jgi:outer membrane receptor protein involved in Fe transport
MRLVLASLLGVLAVAAVRLPPAAAQNQPVTLAQRGDYVPLETVRTHESKMPAALKRAVTLRADSVLLQQVLLDLANQAGLGLSYGEEVVRSRTRVSIDLTRVRVADALAKAVEGTRWSVLVTPTGQVTVVPAEPVQDGSIAGRVTDKATGAAVHGAMVTVDGTELSANTGEDGGYRITGVPVGTHVVRARYIGYAPLALPVTVIADREVAVDFALTAHAVPMDEIVVAGTIVESRRRELSVPVGVIDEQQIRTPSRTRIDQLFRGDIPGIIGLEGSPTASGSYMFVRGRASLDLENLVKIYVDGVETPASALVSAIDLQNVKRMELLRGPEASTIYGSNASGGVLLIFTKDGVAGPPRLSGSASVGTTASDFIDNAPTAMEHRLNIAGGGQGFTYSVGGSYNSAGDWIPQGDSRQAGFTGRGSFTQGPFRFGLTSMYTNRVLGWVDPPGTAVLASVLPEYGVPNNADITTNYQLLGASATYAPNDRWETTLTLGSTGFTDRGRQYAPELATPEDTTYETWLETTDQLSARLHSTLSLQPSPALRSTTTLGVEAARYKSEYFDVDLYGPATEFQEPVPGGFVTPEHVSNSRGAFLQEVLGVRDRLFLTGALRAEYNSNFGENDRVVWAPRVGAAYVIDAGSGVAIKPRASFGKSIRPPDPGQAGGSRSGLFVQQPNPDLRPEIQRGFDLGFDLELASGQLSLEATYFNQTADDLIDQVIFSYADPDAGTPNILQFQNIGTVTNRGLELGLRSRIGPADLTASYTYVKNRVKSLADDYQGFLQVGDHLTYVPRHTAGGTLGFNLPSPIGAGGKRTRLELGVTYIGERTSEDNVTFIACLFGLEPCVDDTPEARDYWVKLPGFVKVRLGVTQPVARQLDAFVNVDNLGNRQAGEFYPFAPARGRALLVGVRFGE